MYDKYYNEYYNIISRQNSDIRINSINSYNLIKNIRYNIEKKMSDINFSSEINTGISKELIHKSETGSSLFDDDPSGYDDIIIDDN